MHEENAQKNIAKAKQNEKIEAAKLLIEQDANLKLKSTEEPESESSSEEQIIIKKKHNKKKPKQIVQEESEEEEEEVKPKKNEPVKQRHLKPQINEEKLSKYKIFDGFC